MTVVIIIAKVMPESPQTDLQKIKSRAQKILEKEAAKNISIQEVPIAFGLKALQVKLDFPEEKGTEIVESLLSKIPGVSSVTIEDYRRAL